MPSPRPDTTGPDFLLLAYVIVDDVVEYISIDYAKQMKLPFTRGWEGWVVYQMSTREPIYGSEDFVSAAHVCIALNKPIL